jgi:hypothetical protein
MKQKIDIEKKIEETLNSLDNIRRASPRPFLYTRLQARIHRENNSWAGVAGFISRPVFAIAMIGVVLFVNGWFLYNNDNGIMTPEPANSSTTIINADVPEEYIAVNTFYDYETP